MDYISELLRLQNIMVHLLLQRQQEQDIGTLLVTIAIRNLRLLRQQYQDGLFVVGLRLLVLLLLRLYLMVEVLL